MATKKVMQPRRGEVYFVNFDPTIGAEIKKVRPALVIQNDVANRYSPITIVAAITSHTDRHLYPTEVFLQASEGGLSVDSVILLNQIRSIDRKRLVKALGVVSKETMLQVERAIMISLGFMEL